MSEYTLSEAERVLLHQAAETLIAADQHPGEGDEDVLTAWELFQKVVDEARAAVLEDMASAYDYPGNWVLTDRETGEPITVPDLLRARAGQIRAQHDPKFLVLEDYHPLEWMPDEDVIREGTKRLKESQPEMWKLWLTFAAENGVRPLPE